MRSDARLAQGASISAPSTGAGAVRTSCSTLPCEGRSRSALDRVASAVPTGRCEADPGRARPAMTACYAAAAAACRRRLAQARAGGRSRRRGRRGSSCRSGSRCTPRSTRSSTCSAATAAATSWRVSTSSSRPSKRAASQSGTLAPVLAGEVRGLLEVLHRHDAGHDRDVDARAPGPCRGSGSRRRCRRRTG